MSMRLLGIKRSMDVAAYVNNKSILVTILIFSLLAYFPLNIKFQNICINGTKDINITQDTVWEPGIYTCNNVQITNGTTLTFNGAVVLNATTLVIDPGAALSADGTGHPAGEGPGGGGASASGGSGGSYGGRGAASFSVPAGGPPYGSATVPVDLGSGGGGRGCSVGTITNGGGPGGGAIQLTISGTLTLNGRISADGSDSLVVCDNRSAGGSGGSGYITTENLTGSGTIHSNGGQSGPSGGGGGGGGRIAIYFEASTFTGTAEANGGQESSETAKRVPSVSSIRSTMISVQALPGVSRPTIALLPSIGLVITDSVDPFPHRSWSLRSANSPANYRRIVCRSDAPLDTLAHGTFSP